MTIYRAAVIGVGIMGRRMITNMQRHPSFELAGVWDPSAEAIARLQGEFPDVPVAASAGELIAAEGTDLVYIACPPLWHRKYALATIEAGKPVYCEKPLGIDLDQSRDLVARLEVGHIPNAVNFAQASSPMASRVVEQLEADALGTVSGAEIILHFSQWPRDWQADADWLRFRDQGGFTREVLSHFLYLTERFFGLAKIDFAQPLYPAGDEGLCETQLQARLQCGDTPIAIHSSSGGVAEDRIEMTIWGDKRSLRIEQFYELSSSDGGAWTDELPADPDRRSTSVQRQLDSVANWVAGKEHPLATAADALSVQTLVETLLQGKSS